MHTLSWGDCKLSSAGPWCLCHLTCLLCFLPTPPHTCRCHIRDKAHCPGLDACSLLSPHLLLSHRQLLLFSCPWYVLVKVCKGTWSSWPRFFISPAFNLHETLVPVSRHLSWCLCPCGLWLSDISEGCAFFLSPWPHKAPASRQLAVNEWTSPAKHDRLYWNIILLSFMSLDLLSSFSSPVTPVVVWACISSCLDSE